MKGAPHPTLPTFLALCSGTALLVHPYNKRQIVGGCQQLAEIFYKIQEFKYLQAIPVAQAHLGQNALP